VPFVVICGTMQSREGVRCILIHHAFPLRNEVIEGRLSYAAKILYRIDYVKRDYLIEENIGDM